MESEPGECLPFTGMKAKSISPNSPILGMEGRPTLRRTLQSERETEQGGAGSTLFLDWLAFHRCLPCSNSLSHTFVLRAISVLVLFYHDKVMKCNKKASH